MRRSQYSEMNQIESTKTESPARHPELSNAHIGKSFAGTTDGADASLRLVRDSTPRSCGKQATMHPTGKETGPETSEPEAKRARRGGAK